DYTENGLDVAMVSEANGAVTVFHDRGIPYRQAAERVNYDGSENNPVTLTFEAGVEYQFCAGCFMNIGWRGDPAVFNSTGTADKPVIFTSANDAPKPGDWNGI